MRLEAAAQLHMLVMRASTWLQPWICMQARYTVPCSCLVSFDCERDGCAQVARNKAITRLEMPQLTFVGKYLSVSLTVMYCELYASMHAPCLCASVQRQGQAFLRVDHATQTAQGCLLPLVQKILQLSYVFRSCVRLHVAAPDPSCKRTALSLQLLGVF